MAGEDFQQLHLGDLTPSHMAMFKKVAEETADATSRKWFTLMGLDADDPIGTQENFVALRTMTAKIKDKEFLADLDSAHRIRVYSEGMIGKALLTAVALAVVGAAHTLWQGIRLSLGVPTTPL